MELSWKIEYNYYIKIEYHWKMWQNENSRPEKVREILYAKIVATLWFISYLTFLLIRLQTYVKDQQTILENYISFIQITQ